jgi:dihydroflavonol-4-reductase
MAKQTILVTGGTGVIGRHLVPCLHKEYPEAIIKIISRGNRLSLSGFPEERLIWLDRDISKRSIIEDFKGVSVVFHLAAEKKDAGKMQSTNVQGTSNVLEACERHKVKRLIYAGTISMLRHSSDISSFMSEDIYEDKDRLKKRPYAMTKLLAQELVDSYSKKMNVCTAMPCMVLGPGDASTTLMLARHAARSFLAPYGGGATLDVRDAAEGFIALMQKGKAGERYILSNENMLYKEMLERISSSGLGRPKKFYRIPLLFRASLPLASFSASLYPKTGISYEMLAASFAFEFCRHDKATDMLDWKPRHPFEISIGDGIKALQQQGLIPDALPTGRFA